MSGDVKMVKDSFILYSNYNEQIKLLNMQERGELLTALFSHVNEEELPTMTSQTKMLYSVIMAQIERDSKKYVETCEKRASGGQKGAEYGALGGRPKKDNTNNNLTDRQFLIQKGFSKEYVMSLSEEECKQKREKLE